ncbi:ROK family protein [Mucilaginibacter terrae]|nr:ROK family protein [Mucilaginibacter terrae]
MRKNGRFILSADIGGSHITAAVIDMDLKQVLESTLIRSPVNSHASHSEILEQWISCLQMVQQLSGSDLDHLAIAMPGPFDYEAGVSLITGLDKYEALYQINVREHLATALNFLQEEIFFVNDAEAFLHGEVISGAAAGQQRVVGFTLGTGMGSATSHNGKTADANWGSLPFRQSIADDYFSSRWFLSASRRQGLHDFENVRDMVRSLHSRPVIEAIFDEFADNFATFIKSRISYNLPECIVIGGNIAKSHHLFLPQIVSAIQQSYPEILIRPATLGDNAALIGAAFCCERAEKT